MPEQLTRHPDVTLQVLRSAGGRCGEGVAPQILETCPAERFCAFPGGEICVYGLGEARRMTQIGAADWQAVLGSPAAAPGSATAPPVAPVTAFGSAIGLLLLGVALGWWLRRLPASKTKEKDT